MDFNASSITSLMDGVVWSPTSPIAKLPTDILFEIFHMVTFASDAPVVQPVVISHVSSTWRALILDMPTIWIHIRVIENLETSTHEFEKTLCRVQHFLNLSRNCPLLLDIALYSYEQHLGVIAPEDPFYVNLEAHRECVKALSRLIGPHARRFKTFNLICDEFTSVADVQSAIPHLPMPLLEKWCVRNTYKEQALGRGLDDADAVNALSILLRPRDMTHGESTLMYPRLTCVILEAIPLDWSRFCPTNLRELTIGYLPTRARPSGSELRQILVCNKDTLEFLILPGGLTRDRVEPYELSNLSYLGLGFNSPSEVIPFIEVAHIPNLTHLDLADIRVHLTHVSERNKLPYPRSTHKLFKAIMKHISLHQLRHLSLGHISFCPPIEEIQFHRSIVFIQNDHNHMITRHALQLFSRLTSLQYLLLIDPDPIILNTINYIPKEGTKDPRMPIPALNILHIKDMAFSLLHQFVETRRERPNAYRRLLALILNVPGNWSAVLKPLIEGALGLDMQLEAALIQL